MKAANLLFIAGIIALCASCSRPRQIQQKDGGTGISFWGFNSETTLSQAQDYISSCDVDYVMDEKPSYATITTEWVSFEQVDYSQVMFYFDSEKKLYKVRCYVSGPLNCKRVQSQFAFRYEQVTESGQKANERIFKGRDGSKAVITSYSAEDYGILQITF